MHEKEFNFSMVSSFIFNQDKSTTMRYYITIMHKNFTTGHGGVFMGKGMKNVLE